MGHTQAAAGVAGIIKMVQAIRHGVAPASLHITEPSRHIEWKGSGVELLTKAKQWPVLPCENNGATRPRRAAVSSFGIGGTNAHMILEQPVEHEHRRTLNYSGQPVLPDALTKTSWTFPWLLSGADKAGLCAQAQALLAAKALHNQNHADIAFSLATTRSALRFRAAVTPNLGGDYQAALTALAQDRPHPDIEMELSSGHASPAKPRLAFLFSGQGSRLPSKSSVEELCASFPVFSKAFRTACDELDRHLELPLTTTLMDSEGDGGDGQLHRTDFAQAILFAFEVAMFRLIESFNIHPDYVAGHSLGEIVAAHVSGALSLRYAANLVAARGKLMAALPSNGVMVSISASEEDVAAELSRRKSDIPESTAIIAAVNSQRSVVVSGTKGAVMAIADTFAGLGRRVAPLRNVKHAFHSPMMNPILADLEKALIQPEESEGELAIPLVSSITGRRTGAAELRSTNHWTRHVSQPVRFADAVSELQKEDVSVFIEVGPSAILSPHVPGTIATSSHVNKLLGALGRLWARGVQVDWRAVFEGAGACVIDLPVYPFQRRRYWLNPPKPVAVQPDDNGSLGHGVLLSVATIPGTRKIICSGYLSMAKQPWLRDHVVSGQIIIPAAVFIEMAMRASRECTMTNDLMVLEECAFVAPLVLDLNAKEGIQVQVLIGEPEKQGKRSVDIYSRPKGAATHHEWTRHATGFFKLALLSSSRGAGSISANKSVSNGNSNRDEDQLPDVSRAYTALADAGISYGPSFQCVRAIWYPYTDGQDEKELRAYIESPQIQNKMFALHPTLLDAALHTSLLAKLDTTAGNLRLPFLVRGVQLFAASTSGPIIARIRQLDENRFSVSLTDKSRGLLVAELSEVLTRERVEPVAAGPTGDLYRLEWTDIAHKPPAEQYVENSHDADDIFRVQGAGDLGAAVAQDTVENTIHRAVAEVLSVVQKWSADKAYAGGRLVIVTQRASIDSEPDVVAAAVWGFVRSAQAESGGNRIVLIDLDGSAESEATLLPALASREEVFALRAGKIVIPRLRKVPVDPDQVLMSTETRISASTLDVTGTVLITGGTGGLGALLSRHIVHAYRAKYLLLVSRSGMKAPGARQLYDELTSAKAVVRIEQCDCGDRAQLATLLASNNSIQTFPPISAIIHCAGVVDDAVLGSQSPRRISRVLRSKVDAAWHLHELAPATVRSFVLFSSFVGLLGNEGQAAYTAANSSLDALARFRFACGQPALSLAWGPWLNEVGMAAEAKLKAKSLRLTGAQPLTDQQGLQLFDMALHKSTPPEPVMLPMLIEGPFPMVSADLGLKMKTSTQGDADTWRTKLAKYSPESYENVLLSLVRSEVAAVLGYQDQELPERPLADLGFDSSTSVLLSNRLRRLTGLYDLPVTLALDHDTLPALVNYLSCRLDIARPGKEAKYEAQLQESMTADETVDVTPGPDIGDSGCRKRVSKPCPTDLDPEPEPEKVNLEMFRGLTALYKRLCQLEQYTAAAELLGCASLALPSFGIQSNLANYAAAPQRLATGPSGPSGLPLPLVFVPAFFPPIVIEGYRGSAYSTLASEMKGERDVFELPHPEVLAIPEDLETLAAVHASTIRENFTGPIILAGYSAGGIVAHAVVSKLCDDHEGEQQNKIQLVGLVLIDTYLNMVGRGGPDWLNALPAEALITCAGDLSQMIGDSDLALAKVGGYFRALRDVQLRVLPATVQTLFLRAQNPTSHMPKNEDEWRPAWPCADVTVDIPGSHLELLDKRCAPASASGIQRWARARADDAWMEWHLPL